jgi:adenylate cyclase
LVDGAPGADGPADVVARIGPMLDEGNVPVARIAAFVRTLHPHIMGRSFVWHRGTPGVQVAEAPYAILHGAEYAVSPAGIVFASGKEFRYRFTPGELPEQPDLRAVAAAGMTDYFALPLRFLDGQVHALAVATDEPGGFREADVAAIRQIVRPLSRVAEILALRRTATNLLSAYVGRDAGERILQGHVQRGDTETIRCITWFADLRGFTGLSAVRDPKDTILLLNRIFDCQVPAVERGGGEVLKFMGDGMLAIFPIPAEPGAEGRVARRALAAANEAFQSLDRANADHPDEPPLAFGLALHVGDVAYGNIGGIGRLDFTCIGPAVNLASRIEGLTAPLGRRLLLSEDFAALVEGECERVGAFPVKGLADPVVVFAPR